MNSNYLGYGKYGFHPIAISAAKPRTDIAVSRDDSEHFHIMPSFGRDGECRMAVNGEDLETWKVCRMAVEELFFL